MERMMDLEEMLRELSEKYKNSKSVEVYEEDLEGWFKLIDDLREENKKLEKYYDRDKEELMESCYALAKENDKLKSDLEECECSMHFENDEVGYRKRECKKLKETIKDHQLYEEKLEHRIIELEELLHGE